jgi:hypothetical protein
VLKMLSKMRRTAKTIFWAVIFVAVLVGITAGWDTIGRWLALIGGGGLVALFGGMKVSDQRELERIKKKNQAIREAIEKQESIKTDLDSKAESWRNKLNKLRRGGLILIICTGLCLVAGPARAAIEGDVYIPEGYNELKALYIQAIKLLDEADQLILEYQILTADQAATIKIQGAMIEKLQDNVAWLARPAWGVTAGIDLGDSAQWRLGVARKKGSISFGAGIGGGDAFSIWWEAGLWIR